MDYARKKYLQNTLKKMRSNNQIGEEYSKLREEYSKRYTSLDSGKLFEIYHMKFDRIEELNKRYKKISSIRNEFPGLKFTLKNIQLKNILKDIDEELMRRERNLQDLVLDMESKGIDIEYHFMNKHYKNLFG